ncbi:MAG: DeoR/GlpR family DNA-binding transcription regulator [Spirochaetota bacterium]|nr:DeoR/GlpR family DNA-binding transcription regulator [Spirochaetota bacterium]
MLSRQEKRLNRIIKMLRLSNPTTVNKLSSIMEVSHMTIRRDLEMLKERKLVDIFHGGVVLKNKKERQHPYSLSFANKQMNQEKKQIAVKASTYINNDDTIIMDTGSTIEYLARSLPDCFPITVICFTLNSLVHVSKMNQAEIIFPGGYFHENTLMFESKEGIELIKTHPANTAFISASGISIEEGVSCSNNYEMKTKTEIINSADKKILLVDSSKFDRVESTLFAKLTDFDLIISDSGIPQKYKDYCKTQGIDLLLV